MHAHATCEELFLIKIDMLQDLISRCVVESNILFLVP